MLDPGHQLGNSRFLAEINRPVDAGGLRKACNSTGTATDSGVPEATIAWQVAERLRQLLKAAGARVVLTRTSNSADRWGPCVDERGRAAARGDLLISIHADGNLSAGAHGFHVISASHGPRPVESERLAVELRDALVRRGLVTSTYLGDRGLDRRDDLGTLNLATRPAVMVELGNLRTAADADALTAPAGQRRYAKALADGVREFLGR